MTAVIAPSILSANFAKLGEEVDAVLAAGADWVHFDVMDNHYVPNLTIGPLVCEALRKHGVTAPIDVHLMVKPVDRIVGDFAQAGATMVSFHPEASEHVHRTIQLIKAGGCQAGLVLNPGTPLWHLDHVLEELDMVLLMSVNPGFGGQSFIASALDKLRAVRERIDRLGKPVRLEIDGGVKVDNIRAIAAAGADTFVAGSAIFNAPDYAAVIAKMRAEIALAAPEMITAEEFARLASAGHNLIPVAREVLSDLDTPLSVYLKLADGPHTYLFESVEGGETWGRYSIIGLPARRTYCFRGHTLEVREHGELVETRELDDPLAEVDRLRASFSVPKLPGLPAFTGGLVGYFGFETIAWIEPRLAQGSLPDELGTPDALLMLSDEVAVFDNLAGRLYLVVHADPAQPQAYARAVRRLDALVHRLRHAGASYPDVLDPSLLREEDFKSGFTRDGFIAAVEKSKEYIRAGDVFQVVLSQRLSVPFRARPVDVYRALRALNPSPYMYFMELGGTQVVGSSPEILVRLQGGTVTVRPIAGTRPRGATPEADAALEAELLADPKERAEHLMLIDLGRNDVGRIAEPGSVAVGEQFVIERYSHVMHIVSEVTGRLRAGLGFADALRATFPAGTVSGAPKIRALEVIRELEPIRRNIYAGAVGYVGWWGDADTAIAIRTAVIQDGRLHVQAGAGIVHDSDPAMEWEETMNKGRALFRAVAQAASGL